MSYSSDQYTGGKPRVLAGSSMGGHTALCLLKQYPSVELVLLFAPAVYARESQDATFADEFGEIIRQTESWRSSPALDALKTYTGNLLVYIGEQDDVIPPQVIDAIDTAATQVAQKAIVRFLDCSHQIRTWLTDHPEEEQQVIDKILDFLT